MKLNYERKKNKEKKNKEIQEMIKIKEQELVKKPKGKRIVYEIKMLKTIREYYDGGT